MWPRGQSPRKLAGEFSAVQTLNFEHPGKELVKITPVFNVSMLTTSSFKYVNNAYYIIIQKLMIKRKNKVLFMMRLI